MPMYTPHSLIEIYNYSITVKDEKMVITIRGIYQEKNSVEYGRFYYDVLRDEASDHTIGLIAPAAYKSST